MLIDSLGLDIVAKMVNPAIKKPSVLSPICMPREESCCTSEIYCVVDLFERKISAATKRAEAMVMILLNCVLGIDRDAL